MPTITIITNYVKKRMSLCDCVCKRCARCAMNACEHESNEAQVFFNYIRLQSNVRQFRSISWNLYSNNLKVNATSGCCCCCYKRLLPIDADATATAFENDVPQNITSIVLRKNTAIWQAWVSEWVSERDAFVHITFVLWLYAFFSLEFLFCSFWIKKRNKQWIRFITVGWVQSRTQYENVKKNKNK